MQGKSFNAFICDDPLPYTLMLLQQTLPALVQLVQHEDLAVKVDACWALSFLAEGKDRQIQVIPLTLLLNSDWLNPNAVNYSFHIV